MSWKKHFTVVSPQKRLEKAIGKAKTGSSAETWGTSSKFSSYLPEVYAGHPQRIERYTQYDEMDQDSEVNAALDTIADFCTQMTEDDDEIFEFVFKSEISETEVTVLEESMRQWVHLNDFKKKIWRIFRSTLKYGDSVFIRDPETLTWNYIMPENVERVIVNEARGKKPEQYLIRNLDFNLQTKTATHPNDYGANLVGTGTNSLQNRPLDMGKWNGGSMNNQSSPAGRTTRFIEGQQNLFPVDAAHVVHLSMTEGLDANWPFGTSLLEGIFKTFRQKELLEEAIIIYRIQRAPERRVFYVDVGDMPQHKVQAYLERIKNEVNQRRIPSRTGDGAHNIIDATYNPMSILDDMWFSINSAGRGSRVETLPGGQNLGEINDLVYWNNKLIRGLRVPTSYLPFGPEDGTAVYNDGRVGTAYLQEARFARYCMRLQTLIVSHFEDEFKLFLKRRGVNIESSLFTLRFHVPENFKESALMERDSARLNNYNQIQNVPYLSNKFKLMRYLGLSEEEIAQNQEMWLLENPEGLDEAEHENMTAGALGGNPGFDSVGLRNTPNEGGMEDFDEQEPNTENPEDNLNSGEGNTISPIGSGAGAPAADTGEEENPL